MHSIVPRAHNRPVHSHTQRRESVNTQLPHLLHTTPLQNKHFHFDTTSERGNLSRGCTITAVQGNPATTNSTMTAKLRTAGLRSSPRPAAAWSRHHHHAIHVTTTNTSITGDRGNKSTRHAPAVSRFSRRQPPPRDTPAPSTVTPPHRQQNPCHNRFNARVRCHTASRDRTSTARLAI